MKKDKNKINRDKYIGIFGILLIFLSMAILKIDLVLLNKGVTILISVIGVIIGIKLSDGFLKPLFGEK